jgi:hypothetical protein
LYVNAVVHDNVHDVVAVVDTVSLLYVALNVDVFDFV